MNPMKLLPIVATAAGGSGRGCRAGSEAPCGSGAPQPVPHEGPGGRPPRAGHLPERSRLSTELFVLPLDGDRFLVYAPLRRTAFVTNARGVDALAELQDGAQPAAGDDLLALLTELQVVDGPDDHPPIDSFTGGGDPHPTAVTLFLTTACNLRCNYCYASAGDTPLERMNLVTARRGIDFVLRNAQVTGTDHVEISLHGGGEPTLNWEVLTGAVEYAESRAAALGIRVCAAIATNGVLTDRKIDWMVQHLASASVSFDGLPAVHDQHRPRPGGLPSSGRVMHTLERFGAAGFPYGLRVTVTAEHISALPDSVEFVCSRFRPDRIQVEPAYQLGRWSESPTAETQAFVDAFRAARGRAAAYGSELTYSAARLGLITNHFCGVTQDLFALSPDGNVSACYEVFSEDQPLAGTFFYGSPDEGDGYRFDPAAVRRLRGQADRHHDFRQGCFAKWSCAGDCYHKALTVGDGTFRGSDRCHITRELTKDQILRAIAESGGLFWADGPDPLPDTTHVS